MSTPIGPPIEAQYSGKLKELIEETVMEYVYLDKMTEEQARAQVEKEVPQLLAMRKKQYQQAGWPLEKIDNQIFAEFGRADDTSFFGKLNELRAESVQAQKDAARGAAQSIYDFGRDPSLKGLGESLGGLIAQPLQPLAPALQAAQPYGDKLTLRGREMGRDVFGELERNLGTNERVRQLLQEQPQLRPFLETLAMSRLPTGDQPITPQDVGDVGALKAGAAYAGLSQVGQASSEFATPEELANAQRINPGLIPQLVAVETGASMLGPEDVIGAGLAKAGLKGSTNISLPRKKEPISTPRVVEQAVETAPDLAPGSARMAQPSAKRGQLGTIDYVPPVERGIPYQQYPDFVNPVPAASDLFPQPGVAKKGKKVVQEPIQPAQDLLNRVAVERGSKVDPTALMAQMRSESEFVKGLNAPTPPGTGKAYEMLPVIRQKKLARQAGPGAQNVNERVGFEDLDPTPVTPLLSDAELIARSGTGVPELPPSTGSLFKQRNLLAPQATVQPPASAKIPVNQRGQAITPSAEIPNLSPIDTSAIKSDPITGARYIEPAPPKLIKKLPETTQSISQLPPPKPVAPKDIKSLGAAGQDFAQKFHAEPTGKSAQTVERVKLEGQRSRIDVEAGELLDKFEKQNMPVTQRRREVEKWVAEKRRTAVAEFKERMREINPNIGETELNDLARGYESVHNDLFLDSVNATAGAIKSLLVLPNPGAHVANVVGDVMLGIGAGLDPVYFAKNFKRILRAITDPSSADFKILLDSGILGSEMFDMNLQMRLKQLRRGADIAEGKAGVLDRMAYLYNEHRKWAGLPWMKDMAAKGYNLPDQFMKAMLFFQAQEVGIRGQGLKFWEKNLMKPDAAIEHVQRFMPNYRTMPPGIRSETASAAMNLFVNPFIRFPYEAARIYGNLARHRPIGAAMAATATLATITGLWVAGSQMMGGPTPSEVVKAYRKLPSYQKKLLFPLPKKDSRGNVRFVDLSYMIPLGDIAGIGMEQFFKPSGKTMQQRGMDFLTATKEHYFESGLLSNRAKYQRPETKYKSFAARTASKIPGVQKALDVYAPPKRKFMEQQTTGREVGEMFGFRQFESGLPALMRSNSEREMLIKTIDLEIAKIMDREKTPNMELTDRIRAVKELNEQKIRAAQEHVNR